jgi:hypothetical protein
MNTRALDYRRGVEDTLRLAERAARELRISPLHCTRKDFAIAALEALAEDGRALIEHRAEADCKRVAR